MGYWNPERKLGVAGRLFRENEATIIVKSSNIQNNVWRCFFFQIEALLFLENAWLHPIFFGYQEHLLSSAFSFCRTTFVSRRDVLFRKTSSLLVIVTKPINGETGQRRNFKTYPHHFLPRHHRHRHHYHHLGLKKKTRDS